MRCSVSERGLGLFVSGLRRCSLSAEMNHPAGELQR